MESDKANEKILIEFVEFDNGKERTVAKFNSMRKFPNNLRL